MALTTDVVATTAAGSVLTDDFNRTGTVSGLGVIPDGPRWQIASGDWQIVVGRPRSTTPPAQTPIAVVYTGINDGDVAANLGGGDGIYLRVADATNWERVRLVELTPYPSATWRLLLETCSDNVITERGRIELGTTRPGRVRLTATGTALRVYLDDLPVAALASSSQANRAAVWHGIGRAATVVDEQLLDLVTINTLNSPPYAPTLTAPTAGAKIARDVVQRFSWTHRDPNSNDPQSAFDLQYRLVGDPVWTTVSGTGTAQYRDFAPGELDSGNYEWIARTYDSRGRVGPWSTSAFFTAAGAPSIATITYPTSGSVIATHGIEVTWSVANQEAYELARVPVSDDGSSPVLGAPYFTTGTMLSSSARADDLLFLVPNRAEYVALRVRVGGLWSEWAYARVTVSYTPPIQPGIWADGDVLTGTIAVTLAHPAPPRGTPLAVDCDFERRIMDLDGVPGMLSSIVTVAEGLPAGQGFVDFDVASDVEYDYRVKVYGDNGTSIYSVWASQYVPADPALPPGSGFAGGLLGGMGQSRPVGWGLNGSLLRGLGAGPSKGVPPVTTDPTTPPAGTGGGGTVPGNPNALTAFVTDGVLASFKSDALLGQTTYKRSTTDRMPLADTTAPNFTSVAGSSMPVGDLTTAGGSWSYLYGNDFTTDVALGSFPGSAYASRFDAYDGFGDTSKNGTYSTAKTIDVSGSALRVDLHNENGTFFVGAPIVRAVDGSSYSGQVYGRYSCRMRSVTLAGNPTGYKVAFMLWPVDDVWPAHGEYDYPETDLGNSSWAAANLHRATSAGGQDSFAVPQSQIITGWHTYTIEWGPGRVECFFDGNSIGASTTQVSTFPMRWTLQCETDTGSTPTTSMRARVEIDWVAMWSRGSGTAPAVARTGSSDDTAALSDATVRSSAVVRAAGPDVAGLSDTTISQVTTGAVARTFTATDPAGAGDSTSTVKTTATTYQLMPRLTKTAAGMIQRNGVNFRTGGVDIFQVVLNDYPSPRLMSHQEIDALFDAAVTLKAGVARAHTLGINIGGNSYNLVTGVSGSGSSPTIQYNAAVWEVIDYAIASAVRHGVYLHIPLTDELGYYHGGKRQWVNYRRPGTCSTDGNVKSANSSTERAAENYFYTDTQIVADYRQYVSDWFNHVNQYTNRANKDEPAVAIFETGNELWTSAQDAPGWAASLCQFVKGLAPAVLTSDGHASDGSALNTTSLASAYVDIMGTHPYTTYGASDVTSQASQASAAGKAYHVGEYPWSKSTAPGIESAIRASGNIFYSAFWSLQNVGDNHNGGPGANEGTDDASLYVPGQNSVEVAAVSRLQAHSQSLMDNAAAAVPPAAPVVLTGDVSDTFTGTNGDPVSSARWTTSGTTSGSSATIQSNAARLQTGTSGGYGDKAVLVSLASARVNERVTFDFTPGDLQEAYFQVTLRSAAQDGSIGDVSSYRVEIATSNGSASIVRRGANPVSIGTGATIAGWAAGVTAHCDFSVIGSTIAVYLWTGSTKPSTPTIQGTNSDVTAAGYAGIVLNGGNTTATRTMTIDNFTLTSS